MDLDQLFQAYNIDIDKSKIKMIRHVQKNDDDWKMIKKGYFDEYKSVQRREDVINKEYILSFLVNEDNRTLFKGMYQVLNMKPYENDVSPFLIPT